MTLSDKNFLPESLSASTPEKGSNALPANTLQQSDYAEMIARELRAKYLWDALADEWVTCSNVAWTPCRSAGVEKRIREALKRERGGYSASYLNGVISLVRHELTAPEWTTSRELLPFTNGVLNLNGKLSSYFTPSQSSHPSHPSQKEYFNWELPYKYDEKATCWTFKRWLITATQGDKELIRFLLAWMVAVARGRSDLQKYLEITGGGGTGKSTFMQICTMLVGEKNRVVTDLKNLENRFESANLYRKRLAVVSDSAHYAGELSTLKAITGGDPIRYEIKNRQAGESFIFGGLVMIAANRVIQSSDNTSGVSRRRIPVYLSHQVPSKEKKRYAKHGGIEPVLQLEAAGIINWILSLDESQAVHTITHPSAVLQKYKLDAESQSNPILGWAFDSLAICDDGNETQVGSKTPKDAGDFTRELDIKTKLYPNYLAWCHGEGRRESSLNSFAHGLVDALKSWGIDAYKHRQGGTGKSIVRHIKLFSEGDQRLIDQVKAVSAGDSENQPVAPDSEGCEPCDDQNSAVYSLAPQDTAIADTGTF